MQYSYKNIEDHNPDKKCKVLISFDHIIADKISNRKINQVGTNYLLEEAI